MASNSCLDDSTSQEGGSDERLTWESLKQTSTKCETVYQEAVDAVKSKSFLPTVGMSLLQHNLPTTSDSSVLHILERRLKIIKNRQIGIILAGEVNAGKSTFVNILMGGSYLPMDIFQTTKLVCELHHDDQEAKAIFKHLDRQLSNITLPLTTEPDSENWKKVRRGIRDKKLTGDGSEMFSRVVIYWRLSLDNEQTVPKQYDMQDRGALQDFIGQMSKPCPRPLTAAADETEVKQLFSAAEGRRQPDPAAAGADRQISNDTESDDESRDTNVAKQVGAQGNALIAHAPDTADVDENAAKGSDFVDSYIYMSQDEHVESLEEPAHKETGGFSLVFLDCPGSLAMDEMSNKPILSNLIMCHTFIFIIDTSRTEDQSNLMKLMNDIEQGLERQNAILSPDNALFVFNKIDTIPSDRSDEAIGKLIETLKTKWHFISPDNVIRLQANKILEDASPDCRDEKARLLKKLQTFIRQSTLLTLEEHLLWLLDMTELAWAMVCRGKRLGQSQKNRLTDMQTQNALILQGIEQINDLDIVEDMQGKLNEVIASHVDSLDDVDWSSLVTKEIESSINGEDWKWVLKQIDKCICEKLCSLLSEDTDKIRGLEDVYHQRIVKRFEKVLAHLKKVQKKMHGLLEKETNVNGSILSVLFSALSTGIIRAPFGAHFTFMAIPLASLLLLVRSIYEEVEYYVGEKARQFFVTEPKDFLRNRARRVLAELSQSKDAKSRLFRHVFGRPVKEQLKEYMTEITDAVQFVLGGSMRCSEEQKDTIGSLMARTMKVYAKHVMTKDIQTSQLTWMHTRYDNRKVVDTGSGSIVYDATYAGRDGKDVPVAVKEVRFVLKGKTDKFCKDIFKECLVMRRLSREQPHQNVIKFYGCDAKFDTDECCVRLVIERCLGNLTVITSNRDVVTKSNKARERQHQFIHYASDCAAGLCFLHQKNVLHRDVKPSNFLLKAAEGTYYRVVISDMGSAKNEDRMATKNVGTPVYYAPEIAKGRLFHSFKSDMYSLGLVFWELWFRSPVYKQFYVDQGQQVRDFPSVKKIGNMVRDCLKKEHYTRPSADTVVDYLDRLKVDSGD